MKSPALRQLLAVCDRLRFEPHAIADSLDSRGHYEIELRPEFPLSIKRFRYSSRQHTSSQTWPERLEVFVPLDGSVKFRMGDQLLPREGGDLLEVDKLKLHPVVNFPGFVYSLSSPSGDYTFLLPFYSKLDRRPHLLRGNSENAAEAHQALARWLQADFSRDERQFVQAGSKVFRLELLFRLARHFRSSAVLRWEFVRQQPRSLRLKRLFDHIQAHFADKLSVSQAARLVAMTPAAFRKIFKQVAGMTLVSYLNHVRLARAAQLLRETDHRVAEIAAETGFSDQSYFARRFKSSFGVSPKVFRTRPSTDVSSAKN